MIRKAIIAGFVCCLTLTPVITFAEAEAGCSGSDTVVEHMNDSMEKMDSDAITISKETIKKPNFSALESCLQGLDNFDINSVLNFSFSGLLGNLIGAAKDMLEDSACNVLVDTLNSGISSVANLASFSYAAPLNTVSGSVGLSKGGSGTVDAKVNKTNSELADVLTHRAEDIMRDYANDGLGEAEGILKGFNAF